MIRPTNIPTPPLPMRVLFIVFGCVFGGVGIAVLVFLWTASGWVEPPLFFRVVGSFIAIAFVAFGATMVWSFVRPRPMLPTAPSVTGVPGSTPVGYTCRRCGATLGKDAEVSPLGDVKCPFCGQWFNIHTAA